jgi:MFS family permease
MFHSVAPPRLFTLVLLSGLSVVSLNMFLPSLSNIAEEFQADYAFVNLSIAGYAGMTAVLQLVMGPLSDRFGRRLVVLAALVIFVLASLGCLLATDIWTFLVFRMM